MRVHQGRKKENVAVGVDAVKMVRSNTGPDHE